MESLPDSLQLRCLEANALLNRDIWFAIALICPFWTKFVFPEN